MVTKKKTTTRKKTATRTTSRATKSNSPKKAITKRKVKKVMHEYKDGTLKSGGSNKKVTKRKQAIAIALSEARKAGGKVKPKKKSSATKRKTTHKSTASRASK